MTTLLMEVVSSAKYFVDYRFHFVPSRTDLMRVMGNLIKRISLTIYNCVCLSVGVKKCNYKSFSFYERRLEKKCYMCGFKSKIIFLPVHHYKSTVNDKTMSRSVIIIKLHI